MIVVTGTKRSGTSMWMQLLAAGGIEVVGEAFPRDWANTIHEANPHGFYESPLRWGVTASAVEKLGERELRSDVAVKIFIPGVCRTATEHLHKVIASLRQWREYAMSIARLRQMEREAKGARTSRPELDPALEWWLENFALLRDVIMRDYAIRFVAYEDVLSAPCDFLTPILAWANVPDIDAAIASVAGDAQTQQRHEIRLEHPLTHRFDELYEVLRTRQQLTASFIDLMNDTHSKMLAAHRHVSHTAHPKIRRA